MATTTRQRLAGGVLIGVAAVAFYLGSQWQGPGLGGTGTGEGSPATGGANQMATDAEKPDNATSDLVGDAAVLVSTASPLTKPTPLVTVVISGNDYLLSTTGDQAAATPAELTDIARAALAAAGDSQGIRVRIFRKKDATAGAKLDLFAKLNDAGVPSEAIQDMREFLD